MTEHDERECDTENRSGHQKQRVAKQRSKIQTKAARISYLACWLVIYKWHFCCWSNPAKILQLSLNHKLNIFTKCKHSTSRVSEEIVYRLLLWTTADGLDCKCDDQGARCLFFPRLIQWNTGTASLIRLNSVICSHWYINLQKLIKKDIMKQTVMGGNAEYRENFHHYPQAQLPNNCPLTSGATTNQRQNRLLWLRGSTNYRCSRHVDHFMVQYASIHSLISSQRNTLILKSPKPIFDLKQKKPNNNKTHLLAVLNRSLIHSS